MKVLIGLFTGILFLDCILLIAFVLIQLPKKEAGAGMAFGGAATDAIFGAGSGSAVTLITKWLAGVFFGLSLLIAVMTSSRWNHSDNDLLNALKNTTGGAPAPISEPGAPVAAPGGSNSSSIPLPGSGSAAAPASAGSNAAPASGGTVAPAVQLPPPSSLAPASTNR